MPRGVPNAKKDESAMRFTSFHVPLPPNPKHVGSNYLKTDTQTLWARKAFNKGKTPSEDVDTAPPETRRGSRVIVIHPGSRWLRIGRASDVTPISMPNVIARKHAPPVPEPSYIEGVSRPRKERARGQPSTVLQPGDEYAVALASDDPFDAKVAAITISLRDRMRFYKLRVTPNAANIASTFNDQFKPETIPDANDPFRVDWIQDTPDEPYLVGEKALRLADPSAQGYVVRWPIYGGKFNTRDYPSTQLIISDIETILRTTLKERLDIDDHSYKDYSIVFVVPDFYDRSYLKDMARTFLVTMGFKQLCVQQESLAATYGAGISNACVVDMGAVTTSIACVDDGLVISDTRMCLNMGGDDITEFVHVLLEKINFPYRDVNLANWYDWNVMEDLKARLCTLAEGDVALNLYDFVVRRPGKATEKYGLRAYDEVILAPMCLFEPRVIEFDQKRRGMRPLTHPDISEEILDQPTDHVTQAMMISTQHLLPAVILVPVPLEAVQVIDPSVMPMPNVAPVPPDLQARPQSAEPTPPPTTHVDEVAEAVKEVDDTIAEPPPMMGDGTAAAPMEIVETEDDVKPIPTAPAQPPPPPQLIGPSMMSSYPGGYTIDVCFEASKLPLDVAIFNSARAAGGDEKIRKYLQAVLIIGGSALIPGMAHALESRLQAIATPLVPHMEKVQIIPPPKDVDPRVLAWKGAAVLGKMDGVAEMWVTPSDWDIFGLRGLKDRCFYL